MKGHDRRLLSGFMGGNAILRLCSRAYSAAHGQTTASHEAETDPNGSIDQILIVVPQWFKN